jgi:Fe-S cluster assembly protein SufD
VSAYAEIFRSATPEGPAWLTAVRQRAMARFEQVGFPTTKNEDWHFTSPAPIAESKFSPMAPGSGTLSSRDIAAWTFGQSEWPLVVFVNGRHMPAL